MVAIPVMKLLTMTIKTLAKPFSKRLKTGAQKHPRLRGVLNNMGQATNQISTRVSIRMAGHTTTKVKPLEEDKAIADGGDLLAEGFIYGLGAFLMIFEYKSSAQEKEEKEAKAKLKKEEEKRELAQALEDLNNRLATLEASGLRRDDPPGGGTDASSTSKDKKVLGLSLVKAPLWQRRARSDAIYSATRPGSKPVAAFNKPARGAVDLPELVGMPTARWLTGIDRFPGRAGRGEGLHQGATLDGEQQRGFSRLSSSSSSGGSMSVSGGNGDDVDEA